MRFSFLSFFFFPLFNRNFDDNKHKSCVQPFVINKFSSSIHWSIHFLSLSFQAAINFTTFQIVSEFYRSNVKATFFSPLLCCLTDFSKQFEKFRVSKHNTKYPRKKKRKEKTRAIAGRAIFISRDPFLSTSQPTSRTLRIIRAGRITIQGAETKTSRLAVRRFECRP